MTRHPLLQDLTLHVRSGYQGYNLEEIKAKWRGRIFRQLDAWLYGQTMAITDDGVVIVYSWDMERFLDGLPVID